MSRKRVLEPILKEEENDSSDSDSDGSNSSTSSSSGSEKYSEKVPVKKEEVVNEVVAKIKVVKPLPKGYVCNACHKVDDHAIYNCPR